MGLVRHDLGSWQVGLVAGSCWPKTRLTSPTLPGYRLVHVARRTSPLTGRTCEGWGGEGCCARRHLAGLGVASVPHSCVPGKCWRAVLMESALPWTCSNPNACPPPRPFPVAEQALLQNHCFTESDFTCQVTRFFFISPMRCMPASCQDDWNQH